MGYVYILECADGSYYVGSTTNVEARVQEHNLGRGTAYTRRRRPARLLWSQQFDRIDEAYAREKQVQGWSRAKREALMEGRLEDLAELSRSKAADEGGPRLGKLDDRGPTGQATSTTESRPAP